MVPGLQMIQTSDQSHGVTGKAQEKEIQVNQVQEWFGNPGGMESGMTWFQMEERIMLSVFFLQHQ